MGEGALIIDSYNQPAPGASRMPYRKKEKIELFE